jgi:hypothetical protein
MTKAERVRRYYHKCVKLPVCLETGMTPMEAHNFLLKRFALVDETETEYIVESTTSMDAERLWMFIHQASEFVISELGISLQKYCDYDDYKTKIIAKES